MNSLVLTLFWHYTGTPLVTQFLDAPYIVTNCVVTLLCNYAITQPFFEQQTPDFVWKFVWTVPTNYEK